MGSDAGQDNEKPAHTVSLSAFEMGRYEVTNRQYAQCARAGVCAAPANKVYNVETSALAPVTDVSWDDAQTFCSWADGGRLPSEAEWEYAARGGLAGKTYPWGDQAPSCAAGAQNGANFSDNETCNPTGVMPVGSFAPNGYGLYDMAGNAWERVGDWYSDTYYASSPPANPQGPATGDFRVLRGGAWFNFDGYLRSANRYWFEPDIRGDFIGFRCARSLP